MNRDKQIEQARGDIKVIINDTIYSISNEDDSKYLAEILCDAGYRKASDVAAEIFAEIEKVRMQHTFGNIGGSELNVKLYYLKKKYTEEEG